MRIDILVFGCDLPIGTSEAQLVRYQGVQFGNISVELREPESRLQLHELRIGRPDECFFHAEKIFRIRKLMFVCRVAMTPSRAKRLIYIPPTNGFDSEMMESSSCRS